MKNKLLIICFLLATSFSFGQNEPATVQYEYLSINVIYGIKSTGFVNKLFIDIGKSGGHSLSGKITNNDNKVLIDRYEFESVTDLINYLGKSGWRLAYLNEIKILSDTYYSYTLEKLK